MHRPSGKRGRRWIRERWIPKAAFYGASCAGFPGPRGEGCDAGQTDYACQSHGLDSIRLSSMPRYLLSFGICVAILSGCATATNVDNVLSGPPKYGEKDLQRLRTYYGRPLPAGTSDAADAARRQSQDYGALVVAATHKDRSALSVLCRCRRWMGRPEKNMQTP